MPVKNFGLGIPSFWEWGNMVDNMSIDGLDLVSQHVKFCDFTGSNVLWALKVLPP